MIALTETDLQAVASLTPREREVLVLAAKGMQLHEIGELAGINRWTVNDHMKRIYQKLDVCSRVEAAVIAAKAGLV